ncbi:TPA: omptin family outer membrane protease [Escherichia coli]|nr:omptin family outer membrane protease [Escherichia coli]
MQTKLLAIMLVAPVVFCSQAASTSDLFSPESINTEINLGTLSGKTKERVYEPEEGGRKVSQLYWKYSNAAILKGAVNWGLNPWLSVGAAGWSTLNSQGEIWLIRTGWIPGFPEHGQMKAGILIHGLIMPTNLI